MALTCHIRCLTAIYKSHITWLRFPSQFPGTPSNSTPYRFSKKEVRPRTERVQARSRRQGRRGWPRFPRAAAQADRTRCRGRTALGQVGAAAWSTLRTGAAAARRRALLSKVFLPGQRFEETSGRSGFGPVLSYVAELATKMTLSGPRSPYLILTRPTVPLLTASSSIVVLMLTPLALRVISRIRRLNRSGAFGAIVRLTLSME